MTKVRQTTRRPVPKKSMTFSADELALVHDALYYYLLSSENGGPDDYPVRYIRRVTSRVSTAREDLDRKIAEGK